MGAPVVGWDHQIANAPTPPKYEICVYTPYCTYPYISTEYVWGIYGVYRRVHTVEYIPVLHARGHTWEVEIELVPYLCLFVLFVCLFVCARALRCAVLALC